MTESFETGKARLASEIERTEFINSYHLRCEPHRSRLALVLFTGMAQKAMLPTIKDAPRQKSSTSKNPHNPTLNTMSLGFSEKAHSPPLASHSRFLAPDSYCWLIRTPSILPRIRTMIGLMDGRIRDQTHKAATDRNRASQLPCHGRRLLVLAGQFYPSRNRRPNANHVQRWPSRCRAMASVFRPGQRTSRRCHEQRDRNS